MEKSEILTQVKDVVSNVLKVDSSEITDDSNFIFDLGADSMQSVELVAGFNGPGQGTGSTEYSRCRKFHR